MSISPLAARTGLMLACALSLVALTGTHTIRVSDARGARFVALVDERLDEARYTDDKQYVAREGSTTFAASGRGELVIFPDDPRLAPRLKGDIDWDDVGEPINVVMNEVVALPVRVLVLFDYKADSVAMTWSSLRTRIAYQVRLAMEIFQSQKLGVTLSLAEGDIRDLHEHNLARKHQLFSCDFAGELRGALRPDPRFVNIYIVRTIDGASGQGHTCDAQTGVIGLCFDALPHLLAHEIGHTLAIPHATEGMRIDNLMQEQADTRSTTYAGQVFRAMFSSSSILNHPNFPGLAFPTSRVCPDEGRTPDVPAPQLRINNR